MKSIIKNNHQDKTIYDKLIGLQSEMQAACLVSGLNFTSNIHPRGIGKWNMSYGVGFFNEPRTVFMGNVQEDADPHFLHIMELIQGKLTSELFPPVMNVEQVSYWKRHLITDMDVTDPSADVGAGKPAVKSLWVGFSESGMEVVRIPDGVRNSDYESVGRIEYAPVPTRGTCVFIVRKDYIEPIRTDKPATASHAATAGSGPTVHAAPMVVDGSTIKEMTKCKNDAMRRVLPRYSTPTPGHTYVVKPGDTLSAIANLAYGDWKYYDHLKEVNSDLILDANELREGIEIIIPKL